MKTLLIISLITITSFIKQQTTKTVDVVCKMKIDPKANNNQTLVHNKVNYTFCSNVCKDAFIKKPDKYIKKQK